MGKIVGRVGVKVSVGFGAPDCPARFADEWTGGGMAGRRNLFHFGEFLLDLFDLFA